MTKSTPDIPICEVANPGGSPCTKPKGHDGGHDLAAYGSLTNTPILDDDAVGEIAEMFPHTEYQPTLSPDEVDPCEFCKGTIDDHKANCVVPHVHALCQTVRALRAENERAIDVLVTAHNDTVANLQSQLEQVMEERDDYRRRLKEWEL